MRRFKSPGHAQRFLAASAYRATRAERFAIWRAVTDGPGHSLSGERAVPHDASAHQQTTQPDFI